VIDLQLKEGEDRGRALFAKFGEAITSMVIQRKNAWFQSRKYNGLKNNCLKMDAYIDGSQAQVSSFVSDINPQIIRRGYHEYTALFNKFFETDPLFSVKRGSKIGRDQESKIIEAINNNLEKTYYRDRCLQWSIDDIVRYGTACTYTYACGDYNANALMTMKTDDGYEESYAQVHNTGDKAVISVPIHPLNVVIDPNTNFMIDPEYKGFLGDITVANLSLLAKNENYHTRNVAEVIAQAKAGMQDSHWFDGKNSERKNYSKGHASILYMWTTLPFEGNEDDSTVYCIEMIGDKIIRIEENVLDGNTVPLAIKRILPRKYEWYGNSVLEDKVALHNLQYWLINTMVESTARQMDRLVFFEEGKIDVSAINARHQTGGLVGVKNAGVPLEKLVFSPALPNTSFRESDYLMQLTRREDQDTSSMPNFNPQSQGGPTNTTLGGAQMMASIGEMKTAAMVQSMACGLKEVAAHQLALLRNIAEGNKDHLLGEVNFAVKVSNTFNYMRESIDASNRLTQVINYKATKLPEFDYINIGTMVKEYIRNSIKRENIDEYVDLEGLSNYEEQQKAQRQQSLVPQPPQQPAQPQQGQNVPAPPMGDTTAAGNAPQITPTQPSLMGGAQ
jgi:hypothetical protein